MSCSSSITCTLYNATNMVMHIRVHIANHPPQVFLLSKREVSKYVEAAAAHPFTGSAAERGAGGGTMVYSYLPLLQYIWGM